MAHVKFDNIWGLGYDAESCIVLGWSCTGGPKLVLLRTWKAEVVVS